MIFFLITDEALSSWCTENRLNKEVASMLHMEGVYTLDDLRQLEHEDIRLMRTRSVNVQTMQLRRLENAWKAFQQQHYDEGMK